MTIPEQMMFSGNLLSWHGKTSPDLKAVPNVTCDATGVRGWSYLRLRSASPLLSGEPSDAPHYEYPFLLRESEGRFLLVSAHGELVLTLVKRASEKAAVFSPSVDVPKLTRDLTQTPGSLCLSALFARVEGYGNSLRSVSLYGNDLAGASLFLDLLPRITPYRVQLRDVRTGQELLSIGSRGEVFFFFRNQQSMRDVDRTLHFLKVSGYLSWAILRGESESPEGTNEHQIE